MLTILLIIIVVLLLTGGGFGYRRRGRRGVYKRSAKDHAGAAPPGVIDLVAARRGRHHFFPWQNATFPV
jgi:hypothetical protein